MEKRTNYDVAPAAAAAGTLNRLPWELQMEVLSLLPVRTLLVLRSVCKWFLSMIDHPDFVSLHLLHCRSHEVVVLNNTEYKWLALQSSVDGVCLIICNRTPGLKKASMLYNPAVERKRLLVGLFNLFALGYHQVDKQRCYRVLALRSNEAWIYRVDEGTWTDVTTRCSGFRPKDLSVVGFSETLCFGGPVVWIESKKSRNSFQLAWFDFGSERFRYSDQELPFPVRSGIFKMDNAVGVWKIDSKKKQAVAFVWACQIDTMAWVPLYTIPEEVVPKSTSPRWGYTIGRRILRVSVRNGKWVCVYWKHLEEARTRPIKVVSYDFKTHAIKRYTKRTMKYSPRFPWYGYYRESLVMI